MQNKKTHPGVMISVKLLNSLKETGGVYCIQPTNFTHKYKIGRAANLPKHLGTYCLAYPTGFYIVALWTGISSDDSWTVEEAMFEAMKDLGHARMFPTCGKRTKATEWIQMEENTTASEHEAIIHGAFDAVRKQFKKGKIIKYK